MDKFYAKEIGIIDEIFKTGYVIELGEYQYFKHWNQGCICTGTLLHATYFEAEEMAEQFVQDSLRFAGLNPFISKVCWLFVSYEQKDGNEMYWSGNKYLSDINQAVAFSNYKDAQNYQKEMSLYNTGFLEYKSLKVKQIIMAA